MIYKASTLVDHVCCKIPNGTGNVMQRLSQASWAFHVRFFLPCRIYSLVQTFQQLGQLALEH